MSERERECVVSERESERVSIVHTNTHTHTHTQEELLKEPTPAPAEYEYGQQVRFVDSLECARKLSHLLFSGSHARTPIYMYVYSYI